MSSVIRSGGFDQLRQNRSMKPSPISTSVRRSGRFSSLDSVGWLAMPAPLSGARSQAIFSAGSSRSASRSSQSSWPAAIAIMRAVTSEASFLATMCA